MKMNLEMQDTLLMFLDKLFCDKLIFVGPESGIDPDLCGPRKCIVHPDVTGIIAFGGSYPFAGADIKIEDFFRFISFYDSVNNDAQGFAFIQQAEWLYYKGKIDMTYDNLPSFLKSNYYDPIKLISTKPNIMENDKRTAGEEPTEAHSEMYENFEKSYLIKIAKICHQANKAWCESDGDFSQKNWLEAEEWQRESAIKGVAFRLNNPIAEKSAQHNAWLNDKVSTGWVYGEVKDAKAKTHPCIVPFYELPAFQQRKDILFCAIVDALK
ncbi:hypothetical protein LCGC14_0938000 [marine sediment metagenome]|uniref:Ryanodine receptor Ryr domain-containing protein n=1 Tax=marine sediment metagenome TaxID=412755 RepID=A0A0F9RSB2_9ZZZZ